jgi:anti-sigma28 factor (negative regulator of flagellin synthesis)
MLDRIGPQNVSVLRVPPPLNARPTTRPADGAAGADDAALVDVAVAAARQAPETRAERVAALRDRIAAGAYRIPDAMLAQKLLDFMA